MRRALAAVAGLLAIGGAAVAIRLSSPRPASSLASTRPCAPEQRPTLALLTSLPLVFPDEFALEGGGSPLLTRIEPDYEVAPIAIADQPSLAGKPMLLMAHPRAQTAEALVDLDAWVRQGGRLLLLADPKLDWPSERALADPLRPPPDFADTGLLAHWGMTLSGPDVDGPAMWEVDGRPILTVSPGRLASRGGCVTGDGGLVARCTIGRGAVTVIADADFLNVAGPGAIDGPVDGNLSAVSRELARLAIRPPAICQHSYPQDNPKNRNGTNS